MSTIYIAPLSDIEKAIDADESELLAAAMAEDVAESILLENFEDFREEMIFDLATQGVPS